MAFTKFLKLIKRDGTEHYSREQNNDNLDIIDKAIEDVSNITAQAHGSSFTLTDASNNCGLYSLYIEGESVQNGTPSPDATIEIESVGDSGSLSVTACGRNYADVELTETITRLGVTFKQSDNGRVHISGTSTGTYAQATPANYKLLNLPQGRYMFKCFAEGDTGNGTIRALLRKDSTDLLSVAANGASEIEITSDSEYKIFFVLVESGITLNCYASAMIVKIDEDVDVYEAYKGNTATITSALPLCSVGDVKDELIFNADGTAKVIKRFEKIVLNGAETWGTQTTSTSGVYRLYSPLKKPANVANNGVAVKGACTHFAVISADNVYRGNEGISTTTTNQISLYFAEYNSSDSATTFKTWLTENPVTFIYELATPEEINLTADETAALLSLETFEGLTNVFNSDNAQMSVKYWRNEDVGSLLTSISRSTNSRLTALENTLIGG